MRYLRQTLTAGLFLLAAALPSRANDDYLPGPDSRIHPNVPAGRLFSFGFSRSKIYPGTTRTCWVYIPAQYTPEHPACLFVCQDGVLWNATVVLDNLIAKHEMPVTIGVFVSPGVLGLAAAASSVTAERYAAFVTPRGTSDPRVLALRSPDPLVAGLALGQNNRICEYGAMDDSYVRFLLEELLPAVAARRTPDGRPIRISPLGRDHAIAGSSAGGICAFTAAWQRPDAFSRVFSSCGSFNLTGGEFYATLIRRSEPKPIRVFLQDGSQDTEGIAGSWWMANQAAERALRFSGGEVAHAWGDGGHTSKQATAIFPDAMRWLWRDWPQPVGTAATHNPFLSVALRDGEQWQRVGGPYQSVRGAAADRRGEMFFGDEGADRIYRVGLDGRVRTFLTDAKHARGLCFGPDGRLYTVSTRSAEVRAYAPDGSAAVIATGIAGEAITIAHNGNIYITAAGSNRGRIWLLKPDGTRQILEPESSRGTAGIALAPAQKLLFVSDPQGAWIDRYAVQTDGSPQYGQRYIQLLRADDGIPCAEAGVRSDRDGRLYVATPLGIQVVAAGSLVNAIMVTPNRRVTDVCFGGGRFDALFALCGDQVFRRRLNVRGANGWDAPNEPGLLKR